MYQKVLVPLDGSELAETTLPHVRQLAQIGALDEVMLLTVVEGIHLVTADVSGAWVSESADVAKLIHDHWANAEAYLEDVQSRLKADAVKTSVAILEGRASQVIVNYAREKSCDLIIIASHGYSGIKQWLFGSVALRVLHDSHVPVLLIRPESHQVM